jgi:X-X-X-Leu-X-X-Gly heptad repeat protein
MDTKKPLKTPKLFICECCDYKCKKQSEFNKHNLTAKHKNNTTPINDNEKRPKTKNTFDCVNCSKIFKDYSGLWRHRFNHTYEIAKQNNNQLRDNYKQLQDNNKQLQDNNKQLQDNSKQLQDNSKQLQDNSKQLQDNSKQLQDNSKQLHNEMKEIKQLMLQLITETVEVKKSIFELTKNGIITQQTTTHLI